jgi:hypothetical protein
MQWEEERESLILQLKHQRQDTFKEDWSKLLKMCKFDMMELFETATDKFCSSYMAKMEWLLRN